MDKYIEVIKENPKIIYPIPTINTPFHKAIKVIFADNTASGRPSPIIDKIMMKEVLPYYANTHSNATTGIMMKNLIKETKDKIREHFNLSPNHKIIFTGNGTTGAVNHLSNLIEPSNFTTINIILSIYEHHSNYLPWLELANKHEHIKIHFIPILDNEDIDLKWLSKKMVELNNDKGCYLNIVSITGCSNITGIYTPIKEISEIVKKYDHEHNYLLLDIACCAPYHKVDGSMVDGMFISMHKFLGGPSTAGLLIADQNLFMKDRPVAPGGGCVVRANTQQVVYDNDLEKRETAGTPNILGIIRIKYVLELKDKYQSIIDRNDMLLSEFVYKYFDMLMSKYPKLSVIFPHKTHKDRLPIISFNIRDMHYNFIVVLLNDLFGIQSRGGISCCGMFGELMRNKFNIDGWCRISFSWLLTKDEINKIINAIEFVIKYGEMFKKYYKYDKEKNLFEYDNEKRFDISNDKLLEYLENTKI